MAAAPPPFSPRDARRQARAQWRAQRDAYKAQRDVYKVQSQYWYGRRRPSFVGPLLLISIGVIALLLETGRLHAWDFWPWYAKWWPALLIFVGLALLLEHLVDRRNPMAGRRSIGGIVWLIALIGLAGAASHKTIIFAPWGQRLFDNFGDGDHDSWLSMVGEEHSRDLTLTQSISANGSLTIDNARGNVNVSAITGEPGREVQVRAHQVVHARSSETAERELDSTRPQLTAQGSDANITVPSRDGASADLQITVPAGIALTLRTTHGDVQVSGLARNVDLNVTRGDVTVDSMGGAVHIVMDHGDVIAHQVAGDLSIDGRADDVSISGLKGRALLNGDFFGDTRLASVGGLVHFHSSRTDLDVPRIDGEMTLDPDNLHLANPSGGLRLITRSKDVEVTDLVGDAHIQDSDGDVSVSSSMPLGNLDLSDRTGAMTVTVPANASFSVHAAVNDSDELNSDFPLSREDNSGHKTLSGEVGSGGPHLELSTSHGDLSLRRGGVHVQQVIVPEVNVPGVNVPGVHVPPVHVPRIVIPPISIPAVPAVPAVPGAPGAPAPPQHHRHSNGDQPESNVQ